MGFGSYDESEQQNQTVEADESDGMKVHEHDHDGEVSFDSGASTDDLLNRLDDMKADDEEAPE